MAGLDPTCLPKYKYVFRTLRGELDAEEGKTSFYTDPVILCLAGNLCYIYTKSFSGFLCTTCKHSRNLKLAAFLYGSYKRFPQGPEAHKYEVRLKLYIADGLLQIRDFQQVRLSNMMLHLYFLTYCSFHISLSNGF